MWVSNFLAENYNTVFYNLKSIDFEMHRSETVFLRCYSSSTHIADLLTLDNGQLPHTCPNSTNVSFFKSHFHSSILHAPWYWQCCLKEKDYPTSTLLPIVACGFQLWDWWMKQLSSDKSKFLSGSSRTHTLSHWSAFLKFKKTTNCEPSHKHAGKHTCVYLL